MPHNYRDFHHDDETSSSIGQREENETQNPFDHNFPWPPSPGIYRPPPQININTSVYHEEILAREQEETGGEVREVKKRIDELMGGGREVKFACHFYRLNPVKYGECGKYILQDPRYVKQHLSRVHFPPKIHCPVCGRTWAPEKKADLHEHIRQRVCEKRDLTFDGILTEEQKSSVRDLKSRKGEADPNTLWFRMWDLLFPQVERPKVELVVLGDTVTEALLVAETAIQQETDTFFYNIQLPYPLVASGSSSIRPILLEALGTMRRTRLQSRVGQPATEAKKREEPTATSWRGIMMPPRCSSPGFDADLRRDLDATFSYDVQPSLSCGTSRTSSSTSTGEDDHIYASAHDDAFRLPDPLGMSAYPLPTFGSLETLNQKDTTDMHQIPYWAREEILGPEYCQGLWYSE